MSKRTRSPQKSAASAGPPPRQKRRTGLVLAGALVVIFVGYVGWANALPAPQVEHRVLPQPNGFEDAARAVSRLPPVTAGSLILDQENNLPAQLRKELAPDEPALQELRRTIHEPFMQPAAPGMVSLDQQWSRFRDAGRELVAESRLAMMEKKPAIAAEYAGDAVELGIRLPRGGGAVARLIGESAELLGLAQLERCITALSLSEAAAAGNRLERLMADESPVVDTLREERRMVLNTTREIVDGRISPEKLGSPVGTLTRRGVRLPWWLYPKRWTYDSLDRGFREVEAKATKAYPDREPFRMPREPFSRIILPIMDELVFTSTKAETALRLVRLELALWAYRAEHHDLYPERLEQVGAPLVGSLPADPFSGKPFIYRRAKKGYQLYSAGPDGLDDEGQAVMLRNLFPDTRGDVLAGHLFPEPQPAHR